jgi:peptidoglycan/xylan/chitin deacetylase (PgdA/CDA1 family)
MRSVILMYHSITDGEPLHLYGVSRKSFYNQISWLIDQEYQFVSLATFVQSRKNKQFAVRRKQVVLTFDDGYLDFLINALPIILRHQLPATVFLVTNMLGQTASWNSHGAKVPLMTDTEARKVKDQGVSLGSHTLTHVDLTTLGDEELHRQLVISQMTLANLGETFFSFSYPWGKYTDREVAAVKVAGFECAVAAGETTPFFLADTYRLGRLTMHRNLDLDSFKRLISDLRLSQQILVLARTFLRRMREKVITN